jgi:chromosome segregation ATPase
MEAQLGLAQGKIQRMEERLDHLQDNKATPSELKEMLLQHNNLEAEIDKLKQENGVMRERTRSVEGLEKDLAEKDEELASAQSKLARQDRLIDEEKGLAALRAANGDGEVDLDPSVLQRRNMALQRQLHALEEDEKELLAKLSNLQAENRKLGRLLAEAEGEREAATEIGKERTAKVQQKLDTLKATAPTSERWSALEGTHASDQELLRELREQVAQLARDLNDEREAKLSAVSAAGRLRGEVDALTEENARLREQIESANKVSSSSGGDGASAQAGEDLAGERAQLEERVQELLVRCGELDEQTKALSDEANKNAGLQNHLLAAQAKAARLEASHATSRMLPNTPTLQERAEAASSSDAALVRQMAAAMKWELVSAQALTDKQRDQINELREELKNIRRDAATSQGRLGGQVESGLDHSDRVEHRLDRAMENIPVEDHVVETERERDELEGACQNLRALLRDLNADFNALTEKQREAAATEGVLLGELKAAHDKLGRLQARLDSAQKFRTPDQEVADAETERDELEKRFHSFMIRNASLEEKLKCIEDQMARKTGTENELDAAVLKASRLERQVAVNPDLSPAVQQEIADAQRGTAAEAVALRKKLGIQQQQIAGLQQSEEEMFGKYRDLQRQMEKLRQDNSANEARMDAELMVAQDQVRRLNERLAASRARSTIESKHPEHDLAVSERDELDARARQLQYENYQLRKQLEASGVRVRVAAAPPAAGGLGELIQAIRDGKTSVQKASSASEVLGGDIRKAQEGAAPDGALLSVRGAAVASAGGVQSSTKALDGALRGAAVASAGGAHGDGKVLDGALLNTRGAAVASAGAAQGSARALDGALLSTRGAAVAGGAQGSAKDPAMSSERSLAVQAPLMAAANGVENVHDHLGESVRSLDKAQSIAEALAAQKEVPLATEVAVRASAPTNAEELEKAIGDLGALREQLERLRDENAGLRRDLEDAEDANKEAAGLREAMQALDEDLRKAAADNEALRKEMARLEGQLAKAEGESAKLRAEMAAMQAQLDRAHQDSQGVRERATGVDAELLGLRNETEALRLQLQDAEEQLEAAQQESQRLRDELQANEQLLDGTQKENDRLRKEVASLGGELEDARQAVQAANNQVRALSLQGDANARLEDKLSQHERAMWDKDQALQEAEKQLREKEKQLRDQEAQLRDRDRALRTAEQQAERAKDAKTVVERERDALRAENTRLALENDALKERIRELEVRVRELEDELARLKREIARILGITPDEVTVPRLAAMPSLQEQIALEVARKFGVPANGTPTERSKHLLNMLRPNGNGNSSSSLNGLSSPLGSSGSLTSGLPRSSRKLSDSMPAGPEYPRRFLALYDFEPINTGRRNAPPEERELAMREGDLVLVHSEERPDGFYLGEINGQRGLVPATFLEELRNADQTPRTRLLGTLGSSHRNRREQVLSPKETMRQGPTTKSLRRPSQSSDGSASSSPHPGSAKRMLARYDYDPKEIDSNALPPGEQLAFRKGEALFVNYGQTTRGDGFAMAQSEDGAMGYVPIDFMEDADMFGNVSLSELRNSSLRGSAVQSPILNGASVRNGSAGTQPQNGLSRGLSYQQSLGGTARPENHQVVGASPNGTVRGGSARDAGREHGGGSGRGRGGAPMSDISPAPFDDRLGSDMAFEPVFTREQVDSVLMPLGMPQSPSSSAATASTKKSFVSRIFTRTQKDKYVPSDS